MPAFSYELHGALAKVATADFVDIFAKNRSVSEQVADGAVAMARLLFRPEDRLADR